jgi:hypothetical protein
MYLLCLRRSLTFAQNPDFVIYIGTDDYFGATGICLGHQPCGDATIQAVINMIDTYNIDYIVQVRIVCSEFDMSVGILFDLQAGIDNFLT